MAPRFSRLLRRGRDASRRDPVPGASRGVVAAATALEDIDLGPPPVLRPAAIFREVLYDPAELSPAWLRARTAITSVPVEPPPPASAVQEPALETAVKVSVASQVASPDAAKPVKRARPPRSTGQPSPPPVGDLESVPVMTDAGVSDAADNRPPVEPTTAGRSKPPKEAGSPKPSPRPTRSRRNAKPASDPGDR